MSKRKFHMKQATLNQGLRFMELDFGSYMDRGENDFALTDPVMLSVIGAKIAYGPLFAYCFRRFGYPQTGWDGYKELVRYYLTTPRPDMVVEVSPYVGDTTDISLRFLVDESVHIAVDDYDLRDRHAWDARSLDWVEQQGLPDWMSEWVEIYNTEIRNAFPHIPVAESWRQCVWVFSAYGDEGSRIFELTSRVAQFRKSLRSEYEKVEPYPPKYRRHADWREWNEDDPLKPFAVAAVMTLEDLRTPIGVRDSCIDAFGCVDAKRNVLLPAASAGYPSGAIGNIAPKEFAKLHGLIVKLGKGNAKHGIEKIMAAMSSAEAGAHESA